MCDAKAMGSQVSDNFCSIVAPRPENEASHVILVGFLGSKEFKDLYLLIADFRSLDLFSSILEKL